MKNLAVSVASLLLILLTGCSRQVSEKDRVLVLEAAVLAHEESCELSPSDANLICSPSEVSLKNFSAMMARHDFGWSVVSNENEVQQEGIEVLCSWRMHEQGTVITFVHKGPPDPFTHRCLVSLGKNGWTGVMEEEHWGLICNDECIANS